MDKLQPVDEFTGPGRLFRLGDGQGTGSLPPVLITHGTFSTAQICAPLAQALAAPDRPVYVVEWRGRDGRPGQFDFHDLAEGEIAAAMAALPGPVHLVGHSGGGLAMAFALLQGGSKAMSLTMIATQGTCLSDGPFFGYWGIRAMDLLGPMLGHWPTKLIGLGPCNESAALLRQWVQFNRARRITTRDGADLLPQLSALDVPVLGLAGAADDLIARPEGCRALTEAFGPDAQFHLCRAATDGEDFTHTRLIRSRTAARSVWPRIAGFIAGVEAGGWAKSRL